MLSAIPNAHILLSPLTTQEAVLSSKIEGTRVTMGEVLEIQAGGQSEAITQPRRDDAEEVLNYRKAMQACVKARAILALYDRLKTPVVDLTHSQFAIWAVDFIFGISLAI
jgi:Fic family protein